MSAFFAIVLLPPEVTGGPPMVGRMSRHRTMLAAARALATMLSRRSRQHAGPVHACGIVTPEGRVVSLAAVRHLARDNAATAPTVDAPPADALRVAAGFLATGNNGWHAAARAE